MNDPLLQPFQTRNLTFKNRIVHAPTTMNMSDGMGYATDKTVGVYEAVENPGPGAYYTMNLTACTECGKCIEVCPCGFLEVS